MKRWGEQKPVRLDAKEGKTDLGYGNFIFVGSSCDMFAEDIPDDWIIPVLIVCNIHNKNKYLFQTKNPARFLAPSIGLSTERDILCTTIETNFFIPQIMKAAPEPERRSIGIGKVADAGFKTMVTVEPILDFNLREMLFFIERAKPFQVNIGADSGNNHLPEPPKEKVLELISELEKFTQVVRKKNLGRLLHE
jgi:hypothetical protein